MKLASLLAFLALASGAFAVTPEVGVDFSGAELTIAFQAAHEWVLESTKKNLIASELLLILYGYYRQSNDGPCNNPAPYPIQQEARRKWDAWKRLGDMSKEDAMREYIRIVKDRFPDLGI
jgi:acyl-CoA-binding protein